MTRSFRNTIGLQHETLIRHGKMHRERSAIRCELRQHRMPHMCKVAADRTQPVSPTVDRAYWFYGQVPEQDSAGTNYCAYEKVKL